MSAFNIGGISTIQRTGADANRVGIVFLGDGYTSSQLATYSSHVNSFVSYLLTGGILSEPFNRYRNFFNIYSIQIISNESGADNPSTQTVVDTALNATYYFDGVTERLLSIDASLGHAALAQGLAGTTISADMKFVTINSSLYGGAGGTFAVYAGGNQSAHEVALHEVGHSFANLADEYVSPDQGPYNGAEPFAANVTKSASGEKWARWLGYDQEGIGVIGAYEGAHYYPTGIFRPSLDSKMRTLDKPFDAIAREAFVLEFYKFVDPIDSATPGSNLVDPAGLNVDVIDTAIIKIRWSVDGQVLSDGSLEAFTFEPFNVVSGTHAITALAYDPTDWVRADRSTLEQQVSWTVTLNRATLRADGVHPLVGGPLSDILIASAQPDSLSGGAGIDTLSYILSNAPVVVRLLTNTVSGGYAQGDTIAGLENVTGSSFNDDLGGSNEANLLDGGPGADRLAGAGGDDLYYVDNAGDRAVEASGEGFDRVLASVSWILGAGSHVEMVTSRDNLSVAPINFTGNEQSQYLYGNAGSNHLDGGGGGDVLVGLNGDDFYHIRTPSDRVIESAGGGNDRVLAAVGWILPASANIEVISTTDHAGAAPISLTGNALSQHVFGNAGANALDGGGGGDVLVGFQGDDLFRIRHALDRAVEASGQGVDRVLAAVSFVLESGAEIELFTTIDNLATAAIDLTGNAYSQYLYGNAGANRLDGGGGGDVLVGLGGDDFYTIRTAADRVIESAGGGSDRVLAASSWVLAAGAEVETLSTTNHAGTAAINLTGNGLSQSMFGNAGANLLDGGGGGDTLIGLGGNDNFYVRSIADRAVEAAGGGSDRLLAGVSFALEAGSEIELVTTIDNFSTAAINLTGNALAQFLYGNAGANRLDGKSGADVLTGFGGADNFAFTSALGGGNIDRITDFSAADDNILLDDAVFTGIGGLGALNPNAFVAGTQAADAGDRIIYDQATGRLLFDADGSGAGAAVLFATIGAGLGLTAGDFVVI